MRPNTITSITEYESLKAKLDKCREETRDKVNDNRFHPAHKDKSCLSRVEEYRKLLGDDVSNYFLLRHNDLDSLINAYGLFCINESNSFRFIQSTDKLRELFKITLKEVREVDEHIFPGNAAQRSTFKVNFDGEQLTEIYCASFGESTLRKLLRPSTYGKVGIFSPGFRHQKLQTFQVTVPVKNVQIHIIWKLEVDGSIPVTNKEMKFISCVAGFSLNKHPCGDDDDGVESKTCEFSINPHFALRRINNNTLPFDTSTIGIYVDRNAELSGKIHFEWGLFNKTVFIGLPNIFI